MSGEQSAASFGDPNAPPPTPKQTPASSIFPSPVFNTPKNNHSHFDDAAGWTPRFAEEYSVFNATPGNLRGSSFDFGTLTPCQPTARHKRLLSSEDAAAGLTSHVDLFSSNIESSSSPSAAVGFARRVSNSPEPLPPASSQPTANAQHAHRVHAQQSGARYQTPKKGRRRTVSIQGQGQTATPPPSVRKGERRLAPKPDSETMHNGQGPRQPAFVETSEHPDMNTFLASPSELFSFQVSADGPDFADQRSLWGPDQGIADMAMGFAGNADVFKSPTPGGKAMDPLDWVKMNHLFQQPGRNPQQNQENAQPSGNRGHVIHSAQMHVDDGQTMFFGAYPTQVGDPFGIIGNNPGVDPGLLFSRPPSSGAHAPFDSVTQPPSSSAPPILQPTQASKASSSRPKAAVGIRRSMSLKESGKQKPAARAAGGSPTKSTGRLGPSRSLSDKRSRGPAARGSMPALVPASRSHAELSISAGVGSGRLAMVRQHRAGGRNLGPPGNQHRLPSLSCIPETLGPRARTQAKFTIDANGRARVETTVIVEEEAPAMLAGNCLGTQALAGHQRWNSSEEDEASSSEDDGPIIIPSRHTSFAVPAGLQRQSRAQAPYNLQRSNGGRGGMPCSSVVGAAQYDCDSEAETITDEVRPTDEAGDAASELRKLRESKRGGSWQTQTRRVALPRLSSARLAGLFPRQETISPTALTESSLVSSSTNPRSYGLRCVCNRLELGGGGDGHMVQCESCEMWLHGRCVNITKMTQPSVYICAFCAHTPSMRGSLVRDDGRLLSSATLSRSATSPPTRKSFKFR